MTSTLTLGLTCPYLSRTGSYDIFGTAPLEDANGVYNSGIFRFRKGVRGATYAVNPGKAQMLSFIGTQEANTESKKMSRPIVRATIRRLLFYVGATAVVLLVWQLQRHVTGTYFEPLIDSLTPLQEKQLDAFLEMNRLITTLGTALLGAIGFLLVNGRKAHLRPGTLWTALGSTVCVGLSLLSGYIVYLGILWMLQNKFFDLNISGIVWARQAHFYTFLLGVIFFADFAFHQLREEDGREGSQDVSGH